MLIPFSRTRSVVLPTPNRPLHSAGSSVPVVELLEGRRLMSGTGYESIDGSGNNTVNLTWGAAGTDLIRLSPAAYTDGVSSPSLTGDLSARTISNLVKSQTDPTSTSAELDTIDGNNLSDFGYAFGQFVDHDMDLTPDGGDSFPIAVSVTDPIGPNDLAFTRSQYDPTTGTSTANPRQQVTEITAYLDLSQVYGSDQATADALRTMSGGRLKTSPGDMLPYFNSTYFTTAQLAAINAAVGGMADDTGVPTSILFATGDTRGNENLELTALETLFVRNHNMLAGKLQKEHPGWTDEQLYQEARKIDIAGYQGMIFDEYLPALLGTKAIPGYTGYKSNVNASIANEFSTVAFRMGHSMVSPTIARDGNDGQAVADEVPLSEDFFDPNLLNPAGVMDPYTGLISTDIGPVLKAEADGNGQAMDNMAVDEIRNLLFGNTGMGGDDLIARDIQRGRDNGIGSYNSLRISMGLAPVTSFAQITSNVTVQNELAAAYPGGVDTIDAFEGGVAEDHVSGSDVGPLFQSILVNQFTRLRDGDRFYFGNEHFNADEMNLLQQVNTLTKVIEANTSVTNLQANAFIYTNSISGVVTAGGNLQPPPGPGTPMRLQQPPAGIAGVLVTLLDSDGDVLATTTTNAKGQYSFNQSVGISTGEYTVSITLKNGSTLTSGPIVITRSGQNPANVNFNIKGPSPIQLFQLAPSAVTEISSLQP
jgi:peroxidase